MSHPRIKGSTRARMQRELDYYMAALNVDPQFAVRKCVFYIRSLALPSHMTARDALADLMRRLNTARESFGIGRPWSTTQLLKCYWARNKRFIRRPMMPMTPDEWAEAAAADRRTFLKLKKMRVETERKNRLARAAS